MGLWRPQKRYVARLVALEGVGGEEAEKSKVGNLPVIQIWSLNAAIVASEYYWKTKKKIFFHPEL